MKFGKLLRSTVDARMPQWRDHVLQYKQIKQFIKAEVAKGQDLTLGSPSCEQMGTAFTSKLDQEVEKVNDFYMDRIEEGVIILHALRQNAEQLGPDSGEQLTACQRAFVSFHFNLLMLQNYVALNFTGIVKILKKFDKKLHQQLRTEYIGAIVELPFYQCQALGQLVEETEKMFRVIEQMRCAQAPTPSPLSAPPQQIPPQGQWPSSQMSQ